MQCPICNVLVVELDINRHLDSNCKDGRVSDSNPSTSKNVSSSRRTEDLKSFAPIFGHKKRPIEPPPPPSQTSDFRHDDLTTPTQQLLSNEPPPKRQKTNIIETTTTSTTPLAERLRPKEFSEFVGQDHLIGPDSLLMHLLQGTNGCAGSMIFWGPSGCGKTTLARLLAKRTDATFKEVSATNSGTTDVKKLMEDAKKLLSLAGR